MTQPTATATQPCFQLKSATVPLTALELHFFDPESFEATLQDKIRQAPGFFRDIPLVISLERYEGPSKELDFFQIIGACRRHTIHVIGVRGGNEDQRRLARNASLALLPALAQRPPEPAPAEPESEPAEAMEAQEPSAKPVPETVSAPAAARVVTQTVRSGQQIYAPDGDLIVLAAVQAGAEVLAGGNIHVYGPLRGRALAGVHGLETARIFCQSLEAELVSVAGHYKISEDLQDHGWKTAVQIRLRDDTLEIKPLDKG